MKKYTDNKNKKYGLLIIMMVVFSLSFLVVFIFLALTFLIKNINLLIRPPAPQQERKYLNIEKVKELFKDLNQ